MSGAELADLLERARAADVTKLELRMTWNCRWEARVTASQITPFHLRVATAERGTMLGALGAALDQLAAGGGDPGHGIP